MFNKIQNKYLKFGTKLLLLISVIFIMDQTVGFILQKLYFSQTSGLLYRTSYSMDSTNADILIFGSSRANHHYVPEIFQDSLKMTYYNTGRDGNGIFYQLAVLKSVLKRYNPKIVILDYYSVLGFSPSDYDRMSSLLPYYKSHSEIQDIVNGRSRYEKIKLLSSTYPYNSLITTMVVGALDFNKNRKPDIKGYIPLYGEWKTDIQSLKDRADLNIDDNKKYAFTHFIDLCKKKGINVFVVYSPIFSLNSDEEEITIANNICIDKDVRFINYSDDSLFLNSPNLFKDIAHLNHQGAFIFSKLLVNEINNATLNGLQISNNTNKK